MSGARALLTLLLAVSTACGATAQPRKDDGFRVRHRPPGDRDVFEALLTIGAVKLTDPSCQNVGRDETDTTVGAYLSSILVEMSQPTGGNYFEIEHIAESAESWVVRAMLGHHESANRWQWGIEFAILKQDGSIDPRSFHCIVAG